MGSFIIAQLELLLRILAAGVCGGAIGYERKTHLKEAGMRTHMIVAIGAAMLMIVSQYGFDDILSRNDYSFDPSRVASQIVSGIGFLGAGMIFFKRDTVSGLTTAAGIWATAGVGMAIGGEMYVLGIVTTILIFVVQTLLHRDYRFLSFPAAIYLGLEFDGGFDEVFFAEERLKSENIEIINNKIRKKENNVICMDLFVKLPPRYDKSRLTNIFKDNPRMRSISY